MSNRVLECLRDAIKLMSIYLILNPVNQVFLDGQGDFDFSHEKRNGYYWYHIFLELRSDQRYPIMRITKMANNANRATATATMTMSLIGILLFAIKGLSESESLFLSKAAHEDRVSR